MKTSVGSMMKVVVMAMLLFPSRTARCADEAALLRLMPESANAVSIVRVARILQSERSQVEKWDQNRGEFLAGAVTIPDWADTLVLGSLVHPSVPEEVWTVMATELPPGVALTQLADPQDMAIERFSGLAGVHTRNGNLAIEFPGRIVAALLPSFRQDVARWVKTVKTRESSGLSPTLLEATKSDGHIVLALDVEDMLDSHRFEQRLKLHPELKDQLTDLSGLVSALSRLRSVRLSVVVTTVTQARLTLDFTEPVAVPGTLLRSVVMAALNDAGIGLDAFESAQVGTSGSSVTLSTELPDDQLRMLLSLILTPRVIVERSLATASPPAGANPPVPSSPARVPPRVRTAPNAASSLRYFNVVSRSIDDLHRSSSKGSNPARTATWHDSFASKIEQLSVEGVDPDLVTFGADVAAKLRALGASLRGAAIEVDTQQKSVTYDVHYDPGWASVGFWGQMGYQAPSANVTSNLAEVRQRQAEAITRWGREREQVWSLIQTERAQVRQRMTDRYGQKF